MRAIRVIAGAILAILLIGLPSTPRAVATGGTTLVIKVDAVDPANQQPFPPFNRLFQYTDFFSREVTVHPGNTINFQAQAFSFHIVALAADEDAARLAYPLVQPDADGNGADISAGTGLPKIVFGNGNFPVTGGTLHGGGVISRDHGKGPPVCGVAVLGQQPCSFGGGDDVEVIGPTVGFGQTGPVQVDQFVRIDAAPGTYRYFDMLHPGMSGTLRVVPPGQPASTQAEIDAASAAQFEADRSQALAVERVLNQAPNAVGPPGHRQHVVLVGASAASNHVEIDEFFPNRPLQVTRGDTVSFVWADPQALHTVALPTGDPRIPEAFGYDCGPVPPFYLPVPDDFNTVPPPGCIEPEAAETQFIGDPGTSPTGTALTSPDQVVNAGMRVGRAFPLRPSSQLWVARTGPATAPGTYRFFCSVHEWMAGTIAVS